MGVKILNMRNKILRICSILFSIFMIFGATIFVWQKDKECKTLNQQRESLMQAIYELENVKSQLENEIVESSEVELGEMEETEEESPVRYMVTFRIKQTHFTFDISEHIKDKMNEILLPVCVDKEYYDSVSIGETINEEFRWGSVIVHGSFGHWNISVDNKEILY